MNKDVIFRDIISAMSRSHRSHPKLLNANPHRDADTFDVNTE